MTDFTAINSEPLFPTPLLIEVVPNRDIDCLALSTILETAAGISHCAAGCARSLRMMDLESGGHSACLQPVEQRAATLASRMTVDTRGAGRPMPWQIRSTAYVADRGEQIELPPAYDAFWSAIYVADDGFGGPPLADQGGELIFHDPRLPMTMMEMPDLRLRLNPRHTTEVYAPEVVVRPSTGTLLLFPGWLRATFRPLRCHGLRIIVNVALVAPL